MNGVISMFSNSCVRRESHEPSQPSPAESVARVETPVVKLDASWLSDEPPERAEPVAASRTDEPNGPTDRDIRAAKRCGIEIDNWMGMTKKARKRAYLEYLAGKKGMSVEEMLLQRDRRLAKKYDMPLECWRRMPLKARILYMARMKRNREARAKVKVEERAVA